MGRLDGKVAVVTGAAGALGLAGAAMFAREGARVVMSDIAPAVLDRAAELQSEGLAVQAHVGDVAEARDVQAMIAMAADSYGRLDVFWSNAGLVDTDWILADTDVVDTSLHHFTRTFAVNTGSVFLAAKYAIPLMIDGGGGSLIATSSMQGFAGDDVLVSYGTSKAALNYLTTAIATRFGRQGVRANAIAPGLIPPKAAADGEDALHKLEDVAPTDLVRRSQLLDLRGAPTDVAAAALFLASDESRFVTGQVLYVDGGLTVHMPTWAGRRGAG